MGKCYKLYVTETADDAAAVARMEIIGEYKSNPFEPILEVWENQNHLGHDYGNEGFLWQAICECKKRMEEQS